VSWTSYHIWWVSELYISPKNQGQGCTKMVAWGYTADALSKPFEDSTRPFVNSYVVWWARTPLPGHKNHSPRLQEQVKDWYNGGNWVHNILAEDSQGGLSWRHRLVLDTAIIGEGEQREVSNIMLDGTNNRQYANNSNAKCSNLWGFLLTTTFLPQLGNRIDVESDNYVVWLNA
jgi:hypothetical protein